MTVFFNIWKHVQGELRSREITLKAKKKIFFFRYIYSYVPSPELCVLSLRISRETLRLT